MKSDSGILQPFFLFQNCFSIFIFLCISKCKWSMYFFKCWEFGWNCFEFVNLIEVTDILAILSHPIHDYDKFPHLGLFSFCKCFSDFWYLHYFNANFSFNFNNFIVMIKKKCEFCQSQWVSVSNLLVFSVVNFLKFLFPIAFWFRFDDRLPHGAKCFIYCFFSTCQSKTGYFCLVV